MLPWSVGLAGDLYGAASIVLGAAFLALAVCVWRSTDKVWPQRLYGYSILYLFLLFSFLLVGGTSAGLWT